MSDFSLTLVLQIKTSKIINDMAKVSIKSEKIIVFGGILFVLDRFDRDSRWDRYLGMTAVMTQVPVPTAIMAKAIYISNCFSHKLLSSHD